MNQDQIPKQCLCRYSGQCLCQYDNTPDILFRMWRADTFDDFKRMLSGYMQVRRNDLMWGERMEVAVRAAQANYDYKMNQDTQRYKQCGNAVTTNVVEAIMTKLLSPSHEL